MKILIQGAMDEEIDCLIQHFKPQKTITISGYNYYLCEYLSNTIIISKTDVGIINATISTTIAINSFSPDLVINQGCAGAHSLELNVGDIVIAQKSIYINYFKTGIREKGQGSNSLDWIPNKRSFVVNCTPKYVDIAKHIVAKNKTICGALGSGDMFTQEYDRIVNLTTKFGHLCEDMESVASLMVCEKFGVGKMAFRIISNSELKHIPLNKDVCKDLQLFVIDFVDTILKDLKD